eukprot:13660681-Ditylum_brightwellii.AAC.1
MGDLFADLENVRVYIDNLLVLTKGNWEDHLANLNEVLTRLSRARLKTGRRPTIKEKVEVILKIAEPTTKAIT